MSILFISLFVLLVSVKLSTEDQLITVYENQSLIESTEVDRFCTMYVELVDQIFELVDQIFSLSIFDPEECSTFLDPNCILAHKLGLRCHCGWTEEDYWRVKEKLWEQERQPCTVCYLYDECIAPNVTCC